MGDRPQRPKVISVAFSEEVLGRLLFGTREIDCPEMELEGNSAELPRGFKGPGYIRRDEDGQILFKIYPTDVPEGFKIDEEWCGACVPGEIVHRKLYYKLKAKDYLDQIWT